MRILTIINVLAMSILLSGCKLFVTVGTGGSVSGSGGSNCSENSVCEIEITDATFIETFTAVPKAGFQFKQWEEGDGYLCGNQTSVHCTLDNTAAAGNSALEAVIASNRSFAIRPIFEMASGYIGSTTSLFDHTDDVEDFLGACQAEYGGGAVWCSEEQFFDAPWEQIVSIPDGGMRLRGYNYKLLNSNGKLERRPTFCYSSNDLSIYIGAALQHSPDYPCTIEKPLACCRP